MSGNCFLNLQTTIIQEQHFRYSLWYRLPWVLWNPSALEWFSKCGPQASIWHHLWVYLNANSWAPPRPSESESLEIGPRKLSYYIFQAYLCSLVFDYHFFKVLMVIHMELPDRAQVTKLHLWWGHSAPSRKPRTVPFIAFQFNGIRVFGQFLLSQKTVLQELDGKNKVSRQWSRSFSFLWTNSPPPEVLLILCKKSLSLRRMNWEP